MQNPDIPDRHSRNAFVMAKYLVKEKGLTSLWHGLSAGIAKTVPKYLTSVVVKGSVLFCLSLLTRLSACFVL